MTQILMRFPSHKKHMNNIKIDCWCSSEVYIGWCKMEGNVWVDNKSSLYDDNC